MTKKTIIRLPANSAFDIEPTHEIEELYADLLDQFGSHYSFAVERYDLHNWRIVGEFDDDDTVHWSCESITLYARGYISGIEKGRELQSEGIL